MDAWKYVAAAIIGNTAALAVLGLLAKSLLEKLIQRDSKRFEIELKAKADETIEQFKNNLQIRTIEHQVRFSRLHEKQATVIAELNAHIIEALWEAECFLSPVVWQGEPNQSVKHQTAMHKLVELYRYFDKHRIYLPNQLCEVVEHLITDVRFHVTHFGSYLKWDDSSLLDHIGKEKLDAMMAGWNAIKNQVPPSEDSSKRNFVLYSAHVLNFYS